MANSVNTLTLDDNLAHLLAEFLKQNIIPPLKSTPSQLAYRWVGGVKGRLEPINVSSALSLEDLIAHYSKTKKLSKTPSSF